MIKILFNAFCLAVALISGISLFVLKYQVKAEEKQLQAIHREILQNKREIHMLEAEWAYLNDPQRLQALVNSQTEWQTIAPEQIVTLSDIPMRPTEAKSEPEIIETESDEQSNETTKPTVQKEFVPVATRQVKTDEKPVASSTKPVETARKSTQENAQKSLDSLAQNAKSLTAENKTSRPASKSQLNGTTGKDFVWSAKKRKRTVNSTPATQRRPVR